MHADQQQFIDLIRQIETSKSPDERETLEIRARTVQRNFADPLHYKADEIIDSALRVVGTRNEESRQAKVFLEEDIQVFSSLEHTPRRHSPSP